MILKGTTRWSFRSISFPKIAWHQIPLDQKNITHPKFNRYMKRNTKRPQSETLDYLQSRSWTSRSLWLLQLRSPFPFSAPNRIPTDFYIKYFSIPKLISGLNQTTTFTCYSVFNFLINLM